MLFNLVKLLILFTVELGSVHNEATFRIPKSELVQRPSSLISVRTKLGTVVGYKQLLRNRAFNVFYGLPYAQPPVGELRFKRTKPIYRFARDPYDALSFKPHCCTRFESGNHHPNDSFSEDCLYLNIWSPDLGTVKSGGTCKKRYPVIVYFLGKDQSIYRMSPYSKPDNPHLVYTGEPFALHEVIYVNFNHRQAAWSMLVDQNLFFFDQNLAIRWVKNNIDGFCGDGERITLLGSSFGSNSIQHHLISRQSNGLIKNAIVGSPTFYFHDLIPTTLGDMKINSFLAIDQLNCVAWNDEAIADRLGSLSEAIRSKYFDGVRLRKETFMEQLRKNWYLGMQSKLRETPRQLDYGYLDGDILKLTEFLAEHLVDRQCLERLPAERIDGLHSNYTDSDDRFPFCYDFDFISTETYLNYKLFGKLTLNPQVNLLIGGLYAEDCKAASLFKDKYYVDQFNAPVMPKTDAWQFIRNYHPSPFEDKPELASRMADYYTNESRLALGDGFYESANSFIADHRYSYAYHFFAYHAAMTAGSVYSYQITQTPSQHWTGYFRPTGPDVYAWLGRCHADELFYLNDEPFRSPERFTDLERQFALRLVETWAHFAKTGRMPRQSNDAAWPMSNKHRPAPRYVELNSKYTRERKFEFEERLETLWRPLVPFLRN